LPALNDMIGDYSIIVSSRFSTMLHEGKIEKKILKNEELKKLFFQVLIISMMTTLICASISLIISGFSDYKVTLLLSLKLALISLLTVLVLIVILFSVAVLTGLYFFRKQEDPNNFLIPLTTAIADFGNVIILSILASLIL
ncbi:magnesium transporter, partial [archaeon]|nr:magnesium transporter [archaeon]